MFEYEFTFVLDGITLDDEDTVRALTDELDPVLFSVHGTVHMTVAGEGPDATAAALATAERARRLAPGLRLLRLDRDIVGVADIAERTGRSRQNVNQWVNGTRHGETPFPAPEGTAGRHPVWLWSEVNDWLRRYGIDDGENRPTRAEMADIDYLLRHGSRTARLHVDLGGVHNGEDIARQLKQHASTTPQFVEFLLRHPEVRDAQGKHILVVSRPDEAVTDLFQRLERYDRPVVLVTVRDRIHARVLAPGVGADADPVPLEPEATVGDWLGLIRLYPGHAFAVDSGDDALGAAPGDSSLQLTTA
ncbi:hypothetical protein FHX37_3213 [Haloactinospora alba]|uniref:Uncharacterized protein n=1 Tax=Haloactinospora alba TaxID=405555 RepID=A0A543NMZ9_9ACTN|nr:hypothetical protein [Haloactinospora alba]TQN33209.1 hypothetical protein FHX37_3213 [Haloactinospora alba]